MNKIQDYKIVTSSDDGYIRFAKNLAENTKNILNKKIYIYDLGISPDNKQQLNANFIKIPTNNSYKEINSQNCIRTIHKPSCILDFLSKHDSNFVFIDADCLFTENFSMPGFDIGLTFKHYREQSREDFSMNGIINAGVIFFNTQKNKKKIVSFVQKWDHLCSKDPDSTDQKVLSDMIYEKALAGFSFTYDNLRFKLLPSEIYNDVKISTGSIFHFKAAGRRKDKFSKYLEEHKTIISSPLQSKIKIYLNRFILQIKKAIRPSRYKNRYKKILKNKTSL